MFKKLLCAVLVLWSSVCIRDAAAFEMLENFFDRLNPGYEEGAIIGLGVRFATQPYEDVDAQVIPVPLINAQYKGFFVDGGSLGYYLMNDEPLRLAVVGAPRFWGYEPDDSNALVGMTKRGWSFDAGLRGSFDHEWFDTEMTVLGDISGEHGGQEISLFVKREFLQGGLTPRAGIKYLTENLADHYFGVNAGEARAGRPAYDVDGGVNFVAGATLALPIGEKWAWVTDATVEVLNDDIQDSPIVEDDTICSFVTGLVYRY